MQSLRGQLLVSSVRLGDPNFARTVVLVLAHDENGALGLVLNRSMGVALRKLSEEVLGQQTPREGVLYRGGPCESAVMVVFDDVAAEPSVIGEMWEAASTGAELTPGLRFSGDREVIELLLRTSGGEARFFAGYSGWSAGQLEGELAEEAWLMLPARPEHVFTEPERLWDLTRTELVMGQRVSPATMPRDASNN